MSDDADLAVRELLRQARQALKGGDHARAEALLLPVRNDPRVAPEANLGLAAVYSRRKDLSRFVAYASRASALTGHYDDAWFFLGRGLEIGYRLHGAEQAYRSACAINPHHRAAQVAAGRVRRLLEGDADTAGTDQRI